MLVRLFMNLMFVSLQLLEFISLIFFTFQALEMTFNIWYRLSEFLYDRNDDSLSEKFRPFIERLLH